MVCASNMNRSMEAHKLLKEGNYNVSSYGVGSHVKLPGPSADAPNKYDFGTPYTEILEDLKAKDTALYVRNGLLKMVERNIQIKDCPQRWQDSRDVFDVVVTFDTGVFEQLVEDMANREPTDGDSVLVINLDVKDTHDEAALAAPQALKLCEMLETSEDWECNLDDIVDRFQQQTGRRPMYTICFY